jgi:hypothetical protein
MFLYYRRILSSRSETFCSHFAFGDVRFTLHVQRRFVLAGAAAKTGMQAGGGRVNRLAYLMVSFDVLAYLVNWFFFLISTCPDIYILYLGF